MGVKKKKKKDLKKLLSLLVVVVVVMAEGECGVDFTTADEKPRADVRETAATVVPRSMPSQSQAGGPAGTLLRADARSSIMNKKALARINAMEGMVTGHPAPPASASHLHSSMMPSCLCLSVFLCVCVSVSLCICVSVSVSVSVSVCVKVKMKVKVKVKVKVKG